MKLMALEKMIERRDRDKIKYRTRINVNQYDYRLKLINEKAGEKVSFLVVGDTGAGGKESDIKFHVADEMNKEEGIDLILHVGDLVYLSGSRQGYKKRFILPYRYWLKNDRNHKYKNMVFNKPFLPIYGNHDYYDFLQAIPLFGSFLGRFHNALGTGSKNGRVFEKAFVETDPSKVVQDLPNEEMVLPYITGKKTRIPNRYYWYTYGPCAFFALDSNTLDQLKKPDPEMMAGMDKQIEEIKEAINQYDAQLELLMGLEDKKLTPQEEALTHDKIEEILDLRKKLSLLQKRKISNRKDFDKAQIAWLKRVLQHKDVQGKWKVVYMHHSLYSSESGHTDDIATGGLRENLRKVFIENGVHLVLSGHSHCFEWAMRTPEDKHESEKTKQLALAERKICYIVSGGGGKGLRESVLEENSESSKVKQDYFLDVAESKAYTATFQKGLKTVLVHNIHNFVRIEATENSLQVFPKGVAQVNGQAMRIDPFMCKVFNSTENGITTQVKHLNCIHVFKNKSPEGVFHPIV